MIYHISGLESIVICHRSRQHPYINSNGPFVHADALTYSNWYQAHPNHLKSKFRPENLRKRSPYSLHTLETNSTFSKNRT